MRIIDADALKEDLGMYRASYNCFDDTERAFYTAMSRAIERVDAALTIPLATFHVIDKKTGDEPDLYEIALHEDWAKHLCYCDMEGFAIGEDGTLWLMDECGNTVYADKERFKVVWDDPEEEMECG